MSENETPQVVDPDWVAAHFTRSDGSFRFARWGRRLAPVIVGTDDFGCSVFEGGIRAVAGLAGLEVSELDPEHGANFLVFLVNDWAELTEAPNLVRLIPNLGDLIEELTRHGANQYRVFNFEPSGAIQLCITMLRYDEELQKVSAQTLAVGQALQGMLLWSDRAFMDESPIAVTEDGTCFVKPGHATLLRASYDAVLPVSATDASFALRLAARMSV
jgi:hypothetical protein